MCKFAFAAVVGGVVFALLAVLAQSYSMNVQHVQLESDDHHHGTMGTDGGDHHGSDHQHEQDHDNHDSNQHHKQATLYHMLVRDVLYKPEIKAAIQQSLTDKEIGPLALKPIAQLICQACQTDENPQCDENVVDAAVASVQDALTILGEQASGSNPSFVALNKVIDAIGAIHNDSELGKITPEIQQLYWDKITKGEFAEFEELKEGMMKIMSGYSNTDESENSGDKVHVSVLNGILRLFLSDRNLQKAVFQSLCDSDDLVSILAGYFQDKYGDAGGLEDAKEFEDTIHTGLQGMLKNWDDRETMFNAMKTMYSKLTGKTLPLQYPMYNGLIQGIKSGEITWDAVLGYMEMAKINPAIIKALSNYDQKIYQRFQEVYIPIYQYAREYLQDHMTPPDQEAMTVAI